MLLLFTPKMQMEESPSLLMREQAWASRAGTEGVQGRGPELSGEKTAGTNGGKRKHKARLRCPSLWDKCQRGVSSGCFQHLWECLSSLLFHPLTSPNLQESHTTVCLLQAEGRGEHAGLAAAQPCVQAFKPRRCPPHRPSCLSYHSRWHQRTSNVQPGSESRTLSVSEGALENPKCPQKGAVPHPSSSLVRQEGQRAVPRSEEETGCPRKKPALPSALWTRAWSPQQPSEMPRISRPPWWGRPGAPGTDPRKPIRPYKTDLRPLSIGFKNNQA